MYNGPATVTFTYNAPAAFLTASGIDAGTVNMALTTQATTTLAGLPVSR